MRNEVLVLACMFALVGCATAPRRPAPPTVLSNAAPAGFSPAIRLVTTDLAGFSRRASSLFSSIRRSAGNGPVSVLELSGGGSAGAFGAGALVGLAKAHERPRFDLVTGVSAGALIAPFAFLGPSWDPQLKAAFTTDYRGLFGRSSSWRFVSRLLLPLGRKSNDPLFRLVDHYVTPELIAAVARESKSGRRLIVATTDLDSEETVLWNMSAIAEHGGKSARVLFRDVLVASASVPGFFPPVLIPVHEGTHAYDELHVDGGVTTTVFAFPLVASLLPHLPPLHGGRLYIIVNGQLAHLPKTTPVNTLSILTRSSLAAETYNTRRAIINTINLSRRLGMQLRVTSIPASFPFRHSLDFNSKYMRKLFAYGEGCAAAGHLWLTPEQANKLNMSARPARKGVPLTCPDTPVPALP
ncbi:MAG: patatin-like phospholipase family protein [Gammaproteobacteria bacterium]